MIAIDPDPKGAQGRAIRKQGGLEIWRKEHADGSAALALFNRGMSPAGIEIRDEDTGLGRIAAVLDLWRGALVPAGSAGSRSPAHGAVMLRLSATSRFLP